MSFRVLPALVVAACLGLVLSGSPASAATPIAIGASTPDPRLGSSGLIQRRFDTNLRPVGAARLSLTFLVWDEPAVRVAVSTLATGSSIDYWHEPENDPTRITPELWADRAVRLAQIVAEQGRVGQVRPAVVLMRWSVAPASQRDAMMARLMPPKVITALQASSGFIGWDTYAAGPRTPDDMYGVPARWSAARGLPWAITETGLAQTPQSDPLVFKAAWQAAFAFVTGTGVPSAPLQFLAWNQPATDGGKWAVQNFPMSAAVWRDAAVRLS